jgi:hypothetical protein
MTTDLDSDIAVAKNNRLSYLGFMNFEPLGFADGTNLYEYVHDSPLDYIDPTGHQGQSATVPTTSTAPATQVGTVPACCAGVELSPDRRSRSVTWMSGVYRSEWKHFLCRRRNVCGWMQ